MDESDTSWTASSSSSGRRAPQRSGAADGSRRLCSVPGSRRGRGRVAPPAATRVLMGALATPDSRIAVAPTPVRPQRSRLHASPPPASCCRSCCRTRPGNEGAPRPTGRRAAGARSPRSRRTVRSPVRTHPTVLPHTLRHVAASTIPSARRTTMPSCLGRSPRPGRTANSTTKAVQSSHPSTKGFASCDNTFGRGGVDASRW